MGLFLDIFPFVPQNQLVRWRIDANFMLALPRPTPDEWEKMDNADILSCRKCFLVKSSAVLIPPHPQVPKVTHTEFCQGRTMRWALAWSFYDDAMAPVSPNSVFAASPPHKTTLKPQPDPCTSSPTSQLSPGSFPPPLKALIVLWGQVYVIFSFVFHLPETLRYPGNPGQGWTAAFSCRCCCGQLLKTLVFKEGFSPTELSLGVLFLLSSLMSSLLVFYSVFDLWESTDRANLLTRKPAERSNRPTFSLLSTLLLLHTSISTELLTPCTRVRACVCVETAFAYVTPHMVDFLITLAHTHIQNVQYMNGVYRVPGHVRH